LPIDHLIESHPAGDDTADGTADGTAHTDHSRSPTTA